MAFAGCGALDVACGRSDTSPCCNTSGRRLAPQALQQRDLARLTSLAAAPIREGQGCFGAAPNWALHACQRPDVACQASLMVSGALASYDIPPQRTGRSHAHARHAEPDSSMPAWLADCISEAAKYLDQAPFLQLLLPTKARAGSSFQRHRVTTAVVQAPQLWHGIAQRLGQARPDVLVLLHPLHMAPAAHSHRALQAARRTAEARQADVLTGIAIGSDWQVQHSAAMQSTARALASGLASPALSGRVGDCCDDEADLPFTHAVAARRDDAGHAHAASASESASSGMQVEYWGVVVQAQRRSEAEGCYVLKTVRSRTPGGDCTCVHYSLVSVCKDEPYASQVAASWLI